MKNKILAGIMALCLMGGVTVIPESIASTVSITASASDTYEGLIYKIGNDDTVTITGYDNSSADIVIPDTIEGLPVTAIGDNAFYNRSKITSIKLPSTLKKIGTSAFEYCDNITSMDIPDGVISIGKAAFRGCSKLKTITLPDSLTTIEAGAFNGCTNLETIALPESVTSIDRAAFISCEKIKELSIPDGVTSIAEYTFELCKSLERITIPDSVTKIEASAFQGCESLIEIIIPNSVTEFDNSYMFNGCKSLERVVISANIKNIDKDIFDYDCENMKELVILNPEAKISNLGIPDTANYIIYGYEGSTAEEYAKKADVRFKNISEYSGMPITTTTTSTTTTGSTNAGIKGDANGDGKISIADAVLIMQSLSNPDEYKLTEKQVLNADVVDAGGGLTTMDALAIQMVDLELISADDLPITSEKLNQILDQK